MLQPLPFQQGFFIAGSNQELTEINKAWIISVHHGYDLLYLWLWESVSLFLLEYGYQLVLFNDSVAIPVDLLEQLE